MNLDDAIDLVTKMTIGPRDLLVVRVAQDASLHTTAWDLVNHARSIPRLQHVPIIITRDDIADIDTLDEDDARRLFAALQRRFGTEVP